MSNWYNVLQKYICPIDTLTRLKVMANVLKKGTSVFHKAYKDLKIACHFDVFTKSVLAVRKYLAKKQDKIHNPFSIT